MSVSAPRSLTLGMLIVLLSCGAAPARAETAPPDTLLDDYMRRMADSTSSYFGMTAQLPDTAGLDSVLVAGLAKPAAPSARAQRAMRLDRSPAFGFNRVDGWQLGGELATGASRGLGRISGRLLYTLGQEDFLGGGRYLRRWTQRGQDAAWTLDLWGGRTTEPFDRDHYDEAYTTIRAVLSGADRHQYVRRDGVRGTLSRETPLGRISASYRDQLESSRATSTTWNLFGKELALGPNGPAAFGRAREAMFAGELHVPNVPLHLQAQHWTAGQATNSDFTYRRTRLAAGGDIGLFGHVVLAPQLEWGRLRGDALAQQAFFLGGGPSVRSLDRNELRGTGKMFARLDAMLLDDVLQLLRIPHPDMFPIQLGAFIGSGAVWGGEAFTGGTATRRDLPRRREWLSETGASLLYRPGIPDLDFFVRLDYVRPLGPEAGREAGWVVTFQRTLNLLPSRDN